MILNGAQDAGCEPNEEGAKVKPTPKWCMVITHSEWAALGKEMEEKLWLLLSWPQSEPQLQGVNRGSTASPQPAAHHSQHSKAAPNAKNVMHDKNDNLCSINLKGMRLF